VPQAADDAVEMADELRELFRMADEASSTPVFTVDEAGAEQQLLDFGGGDDVLPMEDQDDIPLPWAMSGGELALGNELQQPVAEESDVLGTHKSRLFHAFLNTKFEESADNRLWFNELTAQKSRLIVAGCFFELLHFRSHDAVQLSQAEPYGDIEITK
jgi:hypothetical protein